MMPHPHRIVFANEKGGTGKSTTAVHVAVALAYRGANVAAFDLDHRQRTMCRYFENRAETMQRRGIDLPTEDIDLMGGENRQAEFLKRNPSGQSPCLELDDGSHLAEITAICEYLDEVSPGDSLIGSTPEQRAETRMWTRRVDLNICEPMANGFRFSEGLPIFKDRIVTVPEAAEGLKRIAQDRLTWLDGQLDGAGSAINAS